MADTTKMSSRGQIVVPRNIREKLDLEPGDTFAVFASEGAMILKKIGIPTAEEAFDELHEWGRKYAKGKGLKQKDVVEKIHRGRSIKK